MDMKIKIGENGPTRATTPTKTTDSTPKSTPKGEVRPGFRRLLERKTSNTSTTNLSDTDDDFLHLAAIEGVEYESQEGHDSSDNSSASSKDEKTPARAKAATSNFAQAQAAERASASNAHPATPSATPSYPSRSVAKDKNGKKPIQEGFATAKPPSSNSHAGVAAINRTQKSSDKISVDATAAQDSTQICEAAPFQSPSTPPTDRIQLQVEMDPVKMYQADSQEPHRATQIGLGSLVRVEEHLPATIPSIDTSLVYSSPSIESANHLIEPHSLLAHPDTAEQPRDSTRAASIPFTLSSHLAHNSDVSEAIETAPQAIGSSLASTSDASRSAASTAQPLVPAQKSASTFSESTAHLIEPQSTLVHSDTAQQPRDSSKVASSPLTSSSHVTHHVAVERAVETAPHPIVPSVASTTDASRSAASRSAASTAQRLVPTQKSASTQVSPTLTISEAHSSSAPAAQAALGDGFVRLDKLQAPTQNPQLDNHSLSPIERPVAQKIATPSTARETAIPTHQLVVATRDQARIEAPVVTSAHHQQLPTANNSPAPLQTQARAPQLSSAHPRAIALVVEQTPVASVPGSTSVAATPTAQVSTTQTAVVHPRATQTNVAPQVEVRSTPSTVKTLPATNAQAPVAPASTPQAHTARAPVAQTPVAPASTGEAARAPVAQAPVSPSVAKATPQQLSTLSSPKAAESSRSSQPANPNNWTSEAEPRATTTSIHTSQTDAAPLLEQTQRVETPRVETPRIETPRVETPKVSFEADQEPAATQESHTLHLDGNRAHQSPPQASNTMQALTPTAPSAASVHLQVGRAEAIEAQDDPDGVLFDDTEFDLESSSQANASPFNRGLVQQAERMAVAPSTQGIALQQPAAVMSASAPAQTQDAVALVESISVQIAQAHLIDRADTTLVLQNPPLFAGAEIVIQQHKSAPGELSVSFHNLNAQAAGLISSPANQALLRENLVRKGFIIHVLQVAQTASPQTRFTSEGQRVTFKTNDRESSENESQDTHGREGSKERKRR